MKKASYTILVVAVTVIVLLFLSPRTTGRSDNPCSSGPGCHGSQYYQYLDILEGDSASQIPSAIEVGETKTISVVVENSGNPGKYSTLSGVSVTLISKSGHFSVNPPSSYNIGDLPLGRETAMFQIKGISEGFDSLLITARGDNTQHLIYDFSFSDSYSSSITVGHPPPTPTPAPTPTLAPTPSPTSKPTTPAPTPSSTPAPTLSPDETSTPTSISQLSIRLRAPPDGEQWVAGTMRGIKWDTNGGADPLTVSLEYSTVGTDGPWVAIATDMPSNGSVMWKTPNVTSTIYIRAFVTDSANPPETASTLSSVEITAANVEFPLILIPAMLIPAIAILTVLFKRIRRKGNNAGAFSKAPVKSERLKRFLKGH